MADIRRTAVSGREIGGAIADALGLVNATHIVIDIPREGPVTLTVTALPPVEDMVRVAEIVTQYRLFPSTEHD
jgi:hypothetical protein